jgi:hypothetical protein
VEEVFAEKSCNESQVALPLELNRMAWMMSESQQDRVPLESQTQPPLSESQRGMYLQHYSQLPLGQEAKISMLVAQPQLRRQYGPNKKLFLAQPQLR